MKNWEISVTGEKEMVSLGHKLAPIIVNSGLVFISGALGAGKTTLVRGILRGLGYAGAVKSPTFTLVEPYRIGDHNIYHFDLYRLENPEELEFIGSRDYLAGDGLCLVEWPENGSGFLPPPDINVMIHNVNQGRIVRIELKSDRGAVLEDTMSRILEVERATST